MKLLYPFMLISFALLGCASSQAPLTPTQIQAQNMGNTLKSAGKALDACLDNLRDSAANPELAHTFSILDNEVLYRKDDSPNKIALMASTAKITQTQKKALFDGIQAEQKCAKNLDRDLQSAPSLTVIIDTNYADMQIMYAKLISGQINIGQANQEQARIVSKFRTELQVAGQSLAKEYKQQINQEVQAAEARAAQQRAIATQSLVSQLNIFAQQYAQQKVNNNPRYTTCNKVGHYVSCTTY